MQKNEPIRMCIACRERDLQKKLIRLQQNNNNIFPYTGQGRSFYLCSLCSENEKKIKGLVKRFRLSTDDSERFVKYLKELNKNG
ncbi:MAG TPA: DUF448 domain-containing protein [Campylobacterales bacterium]|jgi:predicted RNA-binding protein YlxR (DUF448 family)|nr:DUF448 domain-containing protein [Campylobacterales bacterium]HHD80291.1 DUF448 domain-containing protein [Campylobacterales bacterium]